MTVVLPSLLLSLSLSRARTCSLCLCLSRMRALSPLRTHKTAVCCCVLDPFDHRPLYVDLEHRGVGAIAYEFQAHCVFLKLAVMLSKMGTEK